MKPSGAPGSWARFLRVDRHFGLEKGVEEIAAAMRQFISDYADVRKDFIWPRNWMLVFLVVPSLHRPARQRPRLSWLRAGFPLRMTASCRHPGGQPERIQSRSKSSAAM